MQYDVESFEHMSGNAVAGSYGRLVFSFRGSFILISRVAEQVCDSTDPSEGSLFHTSLPAFVFSLLLMIFIIFD